MPDPTPVLEQDVRIVGGGPADHLSVRYLRLRGSDRQIGRELALVARREHGGAAGPAAAAEPDLERVRRRWFRMNHPVLATRSRP